MVGAAGETNRTYIRNVYSSVASARIMYVDSDNRIGTLSSSRRYKEEVKPMDKSSEGLFSLQPVTFRYKKNIDPAGTAQFGLIAEDVIKVNADLVTPDEEGEPYSVRYDQVNAMLLNEFLKEHRKNEEQQATINELKSTVAQQQKDFQATAASQQKQIEALAAGLQRVSAQLELSKPAPQVVNNP
jgi:predicted ribosome quality control (RQC) complex YloA/Tae2 family protein